MRLRRLLPNIPPVPAAALGAFHVAIGASILVGGPVRFSGPGWVGARAVAPWWVWGLLLTTVGVLVVYGWDNLSDHAEPWVCALLLALGAVPLLFLTIGFAYATTLTQVVSYVGVGLYGALVAAHLHAAIKLLDQPPPPPPEADAR